MTRFIHDQFAKKYLTELLNSFGQVQTSVDIAPELKQADLLFVRDPNTPTKTTNITLVENWQPNPLYLNHSAIQLPKTRFLVV